MRKMVSFFSFLILLMIIFCSFPSIAMGSYYDNPAEEAFSTTRFELLFPQITMDAKNNLFNLSNINIDLTPAGATEDFLDQMKDGRFKTDFSTELKTGLTIGRFSLHLHPWAAGSLRLSPAIPELVFVGYSPNDDGTTKTYDLAGSAANGLAAMALDLKYGHPIRLNEDSELGLGLTLRFIKGILMFNSEVSSGTMKVNEMGEAIIDTTGKYQFIDIDDNNDDYFSEFSGKGLLADIGAVYKKDRWSAGLVLKNIGAIKWENVRQGEYTYHGEFYAGPNGPELSEEEPLSQEAITDYTQRLPLVLQTQGSYRFFKSLYCNLGIETGLTDGWGYSSSPRIWTGVDWKPRFIRLAGDISYHEKQLSYNALVELRLFFFWANLKLGWANDLGGLGASAMAALHF